ncbi:MAG: lipopolysaccharide transport periplasmic protein LptA [Desulfuromonadaceae bacterium]|nr:lipopolysaccharide transport periplasmic protein LptA [Desulfuromonadaceae bacterium]
MKTVALLILLVCLFPLSPAVAGPADKPPVRKDRSNLPITIKSDEMTADNIGKTAIFSGKVVAKQGDITIFSDKLIVNYAEKNGEVDKVEAIGNVRIVQLNRTGIASQAIYESRDGRITLSGTPNPKVMQGLDSVTGKTITYYVDDDKSYVSGGGDPGSRVEAVINPPVRKGNPGGL